MSTTQRPVTGSQDYFNSSRLKVIGLITAATIAVGALGGLAGVAFDPEPVPTQPQLQPGRGAEVGGSLGNSAPLAAPERDLRAFDLRAFDLGAGRISGDATEGPNPVGSVSPGGSGFSSSPAPEPDPATGGGSDGGAATMSGTGVDVYVPPGWEVVTEDAQNVSQTNGAGSYAFAFSTVLDPSVAAGDVIAENLDTFLPPEGYTQRETSDIVPLEAFGGVVSIAALGYEALWVDNQGSATVHGEMYVGVRQDGTVLVIIIEHLPAEDFDAAVDEMGPIVDLTFTRFAGLG